jgi:hypothetical protein
MKVERRGRPSHAPINPEDLPRKFTREYKDRSGKQAIWTYNLDIQPYGPISVEHIYPKGFEEEQEENDLTSKKIPKTKRMYLNEANGKLVGYTRAKVLGLIK